MKVEVKWDDAAREPHVIVLTDRMTEEVQDILKRLSEEEPTMLVGFLNDTVTMLPHEELVRIYAANQKVYAVTAKAEYVLRIRLYEVEERLDKRSFLRISHSEIVHLKQVQSFDLSLSGTILVKLKHGTTTFVSRRYVAKIKEVLGI